MRAILYRSYFLRQVFKVETNEKTTSKAKQTKSSKREIATRQMLLKRQNDYFTRIIDKLKAKNKEIAELNSKLSSENEALKAKLTRERIKKSELLRREQEERNRLKKYYSNRVINCAEPSKAIINIGFSKDKDKTNITGRELNIVFIDGVYCKFSNHLFEDKEARVIIETRREKDSFCLSFCLDCLQAFVNALKYISPDNSYYYDEAHEIEIRCISTFKGQRCFSCYTDKAPCYTIRVHNISFSLCSECKACWLMQLESAIRKLQGNGGT